MNIGFIKVGKSIKFKESTFGAIGGDIDPGNLLRILANNNPTDKFYILGRSDYSKLSQNERSKLFYYDNVINVLGAVKSDNSMSEEFQNKMCRVVQEMLDELNVSIDKIVMIPGPIPTVNIPNRIKKIKYPDEYASVISSSLNYTTPFISYINDNQHIPIIEIVNDPRYTCAQQCRDLMATPVVSLGQFDYEYEKHSIISYENQTKQTKYIKSKYAQMETFFLYNKELHKININDRNVTFSIILNEGKPSRYNLLKEWVLDHVDDVDIYGKWNENLLDHRFKGSKRITEIQDIFLHVRSSFIIPIKTGWVTSKYIELIHAGVVPFLHPTYDTQNHLDFPSFFKPKTPDELYERVNSLKDDNLYLEKINFLREKYCKPGYYDGTIVNNIVMNEIYDNYIKPDITETPKIEQNIIDEW